MWFASAAKNTKVLKDKDEHLSIPVLPCDNMAPIKKPVSAAPVVPATAAATPAPKAKAAAAAKPAAAPAAAPVPAAAPATAVPVAPVAEGAEAAVEVSSMAKLAAKIVSAVSLLKEIQAELKVAQKEFDKLNKTKLKAEKKRANARTTPSGFAKPTKISDELCAFLTVAKGTEMARTEVTRKLNAYIKENGLFDQANKRKILPNAALKKLLGCKDGDDVSYFNVQRYMKRHFIKATPAV